MGYCEAFDGDGWKTATNIGGSEIAMANLADEISKNFPGKYKLVLFGCRFPGCKTDSNGNEWRNAVEMGEYFKNNEVDVLIVWRYIHLIASIPFISKAKKIFVWVHDVVIHCAYNGVMMEGNGYFGPNAGWLVDNFSSKIDGVMCQSEWHSQQLSKMYPRLASKMIIMPNGVDTSLLNNIISSPGFSKIQNRFIWASHHDRNIENLIRMWPLILAKIPTATLSVFGQKTDRTKPLLESFAAQFSGSVAIYDKVDHMTLFEELKKSDVWFYPTYFPETYCMLALEAQLAGCVCVSYNTASLLTTIGNRGFIFDFDQSSPPSDEQIVEKLCYILSPSFTSQRETTRRAACEWAKTQGWRERAISWEGWFQEGSAPPRR